MLRLLSQRMSEQAHGREETFDVWMKKESDLIQASSLAYGEMVRPPAGCYGRTKGRELREALEDDQATQKRRDASTQPIAPESAPA